MAPTDRTAHPSLSPVAPSGAHWIPCRSMLPKVRGPYLVFHPSWPEKVRVVNFGTSRGWENGRDKCRDPEDRITHWMPLPEPPQ